MKSLFVVVLAVLCGLSKAGVCPGKSQAFGENRCLDVVTVSVSSFTDARTYCQRNNSGELVTVTTSGQLYTATNYVLALGSVETTPLYWFGYRYNGQQLEDAQGNNATALVSAEVEGNGPVAPETCVAADFNGNLGRVNCDEQVGFACVFTLSNPVVTMVLVNDTAVAGSETFSIGKPVNVECQFTGTREDSVVQWTLNGVPISEGVTTTINRSSSVLALMPFLRCGEYRCTVTNSDGQMASGSVQLFGDIDNTVSPPGPVNAIAAFASTQTSLLIQWKQPSSTFVVNPLLVSYSLYYSTNSSISYTSGPSVPGLRVRPDGNGFYQLTNLAIGTVYFLGIRAENEQGMSDPPRVTQVAITYGEAPPNAPQNLMLKRNEDNNALLADWDDVSTALPVGRLAFYQVEFRDVRSDRLVSEDITVLFINPQFSGASIFNVRNAQGYEVRVASAVRVQRSPARYELSPFTGWEEVSGIVPEIPTFPTIEPIIEDDKTVEITVAAVVPVVVLVAIIILVIAIAIVHHKRTKDYTSTDGGNICVKCKKNQVAITEPDKIAIAEPDNKMAIAEPNDQMAITEPQDQIAIDPSETKKVSTEV